MTLEKASDRAPRFSRRGILKWLGLGAGAVLFSSCASTPEVAPGPTAASVKGGTAEPTKAGSALTPKPASTGPIKLTVGLWSIRFYTEIQGKSFERYTAQNPNVQVEWFALGWADFWTKINSLLAAGQAPEVLLHTPESFLDYAARSALRNLGPLIDRDNYDINAFWPVLIAMSTWKGKIGAIPSYAAPAMNFYNKDIFSKTGVPFPAQDWTWDVLRENAIKLTKPDNSVYGFALERKMWMSIAWSNGGEFWNDDFTKCTFDDPIVVDAIQWWSDLRLKDKCAPSEAVQKEMSSEMLFQNGRLAMVFHDLSRAQQFIDAKVPFQWAIGWAPWGKKGRRLRLGAGTWSITKDCKTDRLDVAWDVVKWVSSVSEHEAWAKDKLQTPGRMSVARSPLFLTNAPGTARIEGIELMLSMAEYGRMPYKLPNAAEWQENNFDKAVALVEGGYKTAKEACAEATQLANKWLRDNPYSQWGDLV